jgi:hypothetical protein
MRSNFNFIFFALIISIFILSGCRTMTLNQTGENLKARTGESTFNVGLSLDVADFGKPGFGLLAGFQQRFGLTDAIEYQFRLDMQGHTVTHNYPRPGSFNFLDTGPKFRLFKLQGNALSIQPYMGLYGGWSYQDLFTSAYFLGPVSGFRLIGSNKLANHNNTTIYYGLQVESKHDIFSLANDMPNSLNYLYIARVPFIDCDTGMVFGVEIVNKFIFRHEISTGFSFNPVFEYNTVLKRIEGIKMNYMFFTFAYAFGFGGEYSLTGKIKK